MTDVLESWPVWLGFVALFLVAFARGGATYGIGRGLRAGGDRSRWSAHLDRPIVLRAQEWIGRWGAPVVALSFLTVGVQTAVNLAAGVLRMPLRRYLPGLVVGALAWAALYLTIGLAVIGTVVGRLPWWSLVLAAAALAAVVLGSRWIGRRADDRR